jgi:hypothetical protein
MLRYLRMGLVVLGGASAVLGVEGAIPGGLCGFSSSAVCSGPYSQVTSESLSLERGSRRVQARH